MHFLQIYSVNAKGWSDFRNLLNVLPKMYKIIKLNGQEFGEKAEFLKSWKGRKAEK